MERGTKKECSVAEYMAAMRKAVVAPHQKRMLQVHYHAPQRRLTAAEMARAMGYRNRGGANLHYGRLGTLLNEFLRWTPVGKIPLFALVRFEKLNRWHWIMRDPVAKALERLGWTGEDSPILPEEIDENRRFREGGTKRITVNAYERSGAARDQCILHYGCRCSACGNALADRYGDAAHGLIHVHHVYPLSQGRRKASVNPVRDLRPVCPNCHTVIHAKTPPFSVAEVAAMIRRQRRTPVRSRR